MINIKNYILIALAFLLLGAGVAGFGAWHYTSKYDAAQQKILVDGLNLKADAKLAAANKLKAQAELDLANARGKIDNEYKDKLATLQGNVTQLAADNKRLRDPGHKSSSKPAGNNSNIARSSVSTDSSAGLLSEQTSQFLWSFAGEADTYVERLRACKAWSDKLTETINAQNKQLEKLSASGN